VAYFPVSSRGMIADGEDVTTTCRAHLFANDLSLVLVDELEQRDDHREAEADHR